MNFAFTRSVIRYKSIADPQIALRMRLRELAAARVWAMATGVFTYYFGVRAGK